MTPEDILSYIQQAQNGDRQAFQHLVNHMMPRLYGVVYAMLPNRDEVYDILQDTFVKAHRALPKLNEPRAFAGWLTRIAVNTTKTRLMRQREYATEPDALIFAQQAVPDQAVSRLEQADLQALLNQALTELSSEHREVVALVELQEMNCAEAAEILGCPAGTVRSRLHYARKQLKRILSPYRHYLTQEEPQS